MAEQEQTPQERYEQALAALKPRPRRFVEEYLLCLNASEAARRAGYKDFGQSGYENKKKPEIAEAISLGFAAHTMPAAEVLHRLTAMARGSADDFVSVHQVPLTAPDGEPIRDAVGEPIIRHWPALDLQKARNAGALHLIKKISHTANGPAVELYDAQAALALLAKHHGLLVDRQELSGPGGGPIEIDDARDKLADILARRFGASDTDTDPGGDTGA